MNTVYLFSYGQIFYTTFSRKFLSPWVIIYSSNLNIFKLFSRLVVMLPTGYVQRLIVSPHPLSILRLSVTLIIVHLIDIKWYLIFMYILRYNLHIVKLTFLSVQFCYMDFIYECYKCLQLCNHNHNQDIEHFYHPGKFPHASLLPNPLWAISPGSHQ